MIQPTYGTLQVLFADRVFRIPHYQRFYSWRKKQREDLFSDLRKLAERDDDDHHFMATIVCHRTDEVKPAGVHEYRLYDVVDGQQRLTSLIIILKCLHLELEENSDERTELGRILVKADGNLILLQTNNVNEHIFNGFLRDGREPTRDDIRTHADHNLRDAIRESTDFVHGWGEEHGGLMSLLRLVNNRLGFVIYDTDDRRTVYTIFEVLNSRGLPVDWLDKCKSVLMERAFALAASQVAADAAVNSLQNLWGNIYREIADVSVSGEEILRVTVTLQHGPVRGKPRPADDSLELLRAECDSADRPRQIAETILDVTKKLVSLERNVFLGPVTRILQARILAVALMSGDCLNEAEHEKVLDQWERVTFRIFGLFGKDARTKVGEYVRLATKVVNGAEGASRYSEIMDSLRQLGRDYPIERAVEEGLEEADCYENSTQLCRYVLWHYEEHLAQEAGQNATVDDQVRQQIWELRAVDTVEHIFPQNPEPGGAWDGKMRNAEGAVDDHWFHVNRIGNLLLLPPVLNEEAKRRGFAQKKKIYQRHNLRMIHEVLEKKDWTLVEVEERENRIAEWAKSAWDDVTAD